MENRNEIFRSLRRKMEKSGFLYKKSQRPHHQNRKELELVFVHPSLEKKLSDNGYKVRGKNYYIKPLSDDPNCEIGLVTGKSSPLYDISNFRKTNSEDSFDGAGAWTNREHDKAIDKLLNQITDYLGRSAVGKQLSNVATNSWIFRGNREDFDIDAYLTDFSYIYWAIKHPKHQSQVRLGDNVFIWRSKGMSQDPYGIVAFGNIVEGPVHKDQVKHPEYLLEKYWKKQEVSPFKVGIIIESARLTVESGLIDASLLLADDELSRMQLLTARQGTNFPITQDQFRKINELWRGGLYDPEEEEFSSIEGKYRLRLHKARERNKTLVKKAKERFINRFGHLFCEVCGFDFQVLYGFQYAEAHHKKPLSQIKAGEKVRESDLAIICANCHRAVHRLEGDETWQKLQEINRKK